MNVIGLEHNGTPHVVTNPTESAQREKEGDQLEGDAYQCPREGLVESHRKEEAAAPKLPWEIHGAAAAWYLVFS